MGIEGDFIVSPFLKGGKGDFMHKRGAKWGQVNNPYS